MCGISGIFDRNRQDRPLRETVQAMMDSMFHRGPDDEGIYDEPGFCFGMRRLSIIDIASGQQPIFNETSDIGIVFNGEIYNFIELREDLKNRGHQFKTASDTEVIVHLYEEYGTDCFVKLNGMFGLAIWDKQKRSLFLARDRFGIKPLNYAEVAGKLVFGSEIHLVLKDGDVSRDMDFEALDDYLAYYYINAPRTLFSDVRKLPSASFLKCDSSGIEIKKYWSPGYEIDSSLTEADYAEKIREELDKSIKLQLQSEVPLGVFLSGGLDSTSIVSYMSKYVSGRLKTFSIGFDDASYSELNEAAMVAEMFGTDHHPTVMQAEKVPELLPQLIQNMGEPNGDWSGVANYLVSLEAKKEVTVVLRGDGGDEIFGGYPTYNAYEIVKKLRMIPGFIRNGIMKPLIHALPVSDKRLSFDYKAKRLIEGVDYSPVEGHYSWKEIFPAHLRREIVSEKYSAGIDSRRVIEELEAVASEINAPAVLDTLMYLDLRVFNQGSTLPVSDITSMATSIEGRVPFLHNEVVDLANSIPASMKTKGMETKYIFRKAMEPILPPEITKMKKKGFVVPGASWIKNELKEFIQDNLSEESLKQIPYMQGAPVQKVLRDHFDGKIDNTRRITCLLALKIWHDRFQN